MPPKKPRRESDYLQKKKRKRLGIYRSVIHIRKQGFNEGGEGNRWGKKERKMHQGGAGRSDAEHNEERRKGEETFLPSLSEKNALLSQKRKKKWVGVRMLTGRNPWESGEKKNRSRSRCSDQLLEQEESFCKKGGPVEEKKKAKKSAEGKKNG